MVLEDGAARTEGHHHLCCVSLCLMDHNYNTWNVCGACFPEAQSRVLHTLLLVWLLSVMSFPWEMLFNSRSACGNWLGREEALCVK